MHHASLGIFIALAALVILSLSLGSALPLLLGTLVLGVVWIEFFVDVGKGG